MAEVLAELPAPAGVLLDLGISSPQVRALVRLKPFLWTLYGCGVLRGLGGNGALVRSVPVPQRRRVRLSGAPPPQFDDAHRGFRPEQDGPLDLRFDQTAGQVRRRRSSVPYPWLLPSMDPVLST
jgi:hypothetical protein